LKEFAHGSQKKRNCRSDLEGRDKPVTAVREGGGGPQGLRNCRWLKRESRERMFWNGVAY